MHLIGKGENQPSAEGIQLPNEKRQFSVQENQSPIKVFFLDSTALRRASYLLYDIPRHPDHEIRIVISMAEVRAYAMGNYADGQQVLDGIAMIQSCAEYGYYYRHNDIGRRHYERDRVRFCAMPAQPHQRELITRVFTQQLLSSSETGGAFSSITSGATSCTPHEASGQTSYGEFYARSSYHYALNRKTVDYVTTSFLIEAAEDYLQQRMAQGEVIDPHDVIVVSSDRITCLDATAMGWQCASVDHAIADAGIKELPLSNFGAAAGLA